MPMSNAFQCALGCRFVAIIFEKPIVFPDHGGQAPLAAQPFTDARKAFIIRRAARIPNETRGVLAECKWERIATADTSGLAGLIVQRCADLAARYCSKLMGSDQASILGL